MNLVGHNYVAYKVLGHVSSYTILGSHIPDFVPFLPSSVFSFNEIHENHEEFLRFIRNKYPDMIDLPLSMMCHSVKYGVDEYNRSIDEWLLKNNENLTNTLSKMISEASDIPYEMARGPRLHNYLWCGVDLYLIKNKPEFTSKLAKLLKKIAYKDTAKILGEFYNKEYSDILTNLKDHFTHIKPDTFQDTKALTNFWGKFLSQIKEGDNLNTDKGVVLLEYIYKTFENKWENTIKKVTQNVKKKMQPFLA